MTRAIIYARVSSPKQSTPDKPSIEDQVTSCKDLIETKGWELIDTITEVHTAEEMDRPGLNNVLKLARSGVRHVVVWDTSRFMRNLNFAQMVQAMVQLAGASLHFIKQPELGDELADSIMRTFHYAADQIENEKRKERTLKGRKRVLRKGKWIFQTPFGYNLENGKVEVNTSEVAALRTLVSLYLDGHTNAAIIAHLDREGHPTRRGKRWSVGTLARILRNSEIYARGELRAQMKGEVFTHTVKPLLSRQTVTAIKDKRKANKSDRTPRPSRDFLLRGLLTSACGRLFQAKSWWKTGRKSRGANYRCPVPSKEHHKDCARSVGAVTAEEYVMKVIRSTFLDEDAGYAWIRITSNMLQDNRAETDETIAHAEAQLRRLENERLNLDRQLVRGAIDERNHGLLTTENAGEIVIYETQLEDARARLGAAQDVEEFERRANGFVDRGAELSMTPEGRIELCHALIEKVFVSRDPDGTPHFKLVWKMSVNSSVS